MSQDLELIKKYYLSIKENAIDPELFTEDFQFRGPLAKANSREEYLQLMTAMAEVFECEEIQFRGLFADGLGNGCAVYDFVTSKPKPITTECAEFFEINEGKISAIRMIYDAREWEKSLPAAPVL